MSWTCTLSDAIVTFSEISNLLFIRLTGLLERNALMREMLYLFIHLQGELMCVIPSVSCIMSALDTSALSTCTAFGYVTIIEIIYQRLCHG